MDATTELATMLFGDGASELVSKLSTAEREKSHRRQAQVGLASNVIGLTAGAAGFSAALKDPRLQEGGRFNRKLYSAGESIERTAKRTKGGRKYYKLIQKPGVPAKLAAGAVGLQGLNLAGDAVANRVLARSAKKQPVKKSDPGSADIHVPGMGALKRKAGQKALEEGRKRAPELKRGALKVMNGGPGGQFKPVQKNIDVTWEGEFSKVDSDKRQVFGWASIVEKDGQPVVDLQGDYIDIDEIEKSAYEYVIKSRKGGDMHRRNPDDTPVHSSDMIESFLVTPEKIEKMGLPDTMPIGWWVGYQINDDDAWNLVKSGKRTGFSIHGRGQRTSAEV